MSLEEGDDIPEVALDNSTVVCESIGEEVSPLLWVLESGPVLSSLWLACLSTVESTEVASEEGDDIPEVALDKSTVVCLSIEEEVSPLLWVLESGPGLSSLWLACLSTVESTEVESEEGDDMPEVALDESTVVCESIVEEVSPLVWVLDLGPVL